MEFSFRDWNEFLIFGFWRRYSLTYKFCNIPWLVNLKLFIRIKNLWLAYYLTSYCISMFEYCNDDKIYTINHCSGNYIILKISSWLWVIYSRVSWFISKINIYQLIWVENKENPPVVPYHYSDNFNEFWWIYTKVIFTLHAGMHTMVIYHLCWGKNVLALCFWVIWRVNRDWCNGWYSNYKWISAITVLHRINTLIAERPIWHHFGPKLIWT